jgi:hypothetical protein
MRNRWLGLLTGALLLLVGGAAHAQTTPASATAGQAATLDTDSHLIAWWKFEETSGKSASDSSGRGHAGMLEGTLSFDTHSATGRIGGAIKFGGGNDCIRVPDFKGVTGAGPRTVAVWLKTASTSGEIVSWGANDAGKMWNFGYVRGGIGVTPKGGYLYMKDPTHDEQWHHVAAVVSEASPPNLHDDVKLFKDGEPATIDDIGLLDLWPIETGDKLDVSIGRRFKGLLDDLRIYDRALSADEINALFKLESHRPPPKS